MTARRRDRGDAVPATIALFRGIAASSDDALISDGPVHPDHRLLGLCADALHHLNSLERVLAEHRQEIGEHDWNASPTETDAWRKRCAALEATTEEHRRLAMRTLRALARIPAVTPAGIYGKAMACRASRTGAPVLAKSLADDLVACQALRAVLWPGEVAEVRGAVATAVR